MQGACSDFDPNTTAREPAQVLAARIRWQLDEIRGQQLPRLVLARRRLHAEAAEWDHAPLAQAIAAFQAAGRSIHFMPLRQGWFARLLGRHREPFAQFAAAYERMSHCESQLKTQLMQLSADPQGHHSGARQAFAEFEACTQSLGTAVDESVACLHEMCSELASTRMGGREDELVAMAEIAQSFMQDLKRLQTLSVMAQDAVVRARSVLTRRSALLEQARGELVTFEQAWVHRMGEIVSAIEARLDPSPHIPKAIDVHDELMKRLEASGDACAALRHEEQAMSHQLAMLEHEFEEPRAQP
jgi:hypothetical protein